MKKWLGIAAGIPSFLFPPAYGHTQTSDLRVLHVNDFHGFAEAYKPLGSREPLGGIAYLGAG